MGVGPSYKYRNKSFAGNTRKRNNNPDPQNFKVLREQKIGNFLVLEVKYPDATNYEGVKILVYRGFSRYTDILINTNNQLDPHFSDFGISPIARFKPDKFGLAAAIAFAKMLSDA